MKKFKTNSNRRETYTYTFTSIDENGNSVIKKVVLRPKQKDDEKNQNQDNENRVPPELIKELHRLDDNEVNNNYRNWHPKLTKTQQQNKVEWEKAHPGEEYPMPYNYSLDSMESDDGDISKSHVLASASLNPFADDVSPNIIRLREIVETILTESQRTALTLIEYEGYTGKEAADIMGISHSMATRHYRNAMERIRKNF